MTASTRFLSAVAVAFVAGVASTGVYMSRDDAHRDVAGTSHEAVPSLSERLRAEAHGQPLPWSDPVKLTAAAPAPPKLRFTPGPAAVPGEGAKSVADGERSPVPQAPPALAPVRPTDEGRGRPRIGLADRGRHARPALDVDGPRLGALETARRGLDEQGGHARSRVAEAARPNPKPQPAPSRNLPSLHAVDEARLAARRPEPSRARAPVPTPYRTVRLAGRDDLDVDAHAPRRSVVASDGLMRWLSGPGGQF